MTAPSYQSFAEAKLTTDGVSEIIINKPAGVVENDLMIAAVSIKPGPTTITCSGWTMIQKSYNYNRSIYVLYKVAGASEGSSYTFEWLLETDYEAYGYIMRITGHDTSSPVNISGIDDGRDALPTCISITTTKDDCLILRFFSAERDDITVDGGYPSGTTGITCDKSSTSGSSCSGGAAYETLSSAGATGTAAFSLTATNWWLAVSVAIQPASAVSSSVSASPSSSPSISASISSSVSVSVSASLSSSPSISASISSSKSASPSISASISSSVSASLSASVSASISASVSPSLSASISASVSSSPSISASISSSVSASLSASVSSSFSGSVSASISASISSSTSISASISSSISASISASVSASPSAIDGSGYSAYTSGGTVQWVENKFTNLDHLVAEDVNVLVTDVDDTTSVHDDETVNSSGEITLDDYYRKAIAGLSYRYTLKPMRFDISNQLETTHGSLMRISEIVVSFYKTLGAKYGEDTDNLKDFDEFGSTVYTGDTVAHLDTGFSREGNIVISGNDPLPCTVRAIVLRTEKVGR